MRMSIIQNIFECLKKRYAVWGPLRNEEGLFIGRIESFEDLVLEPKIPTNNYKKIFFPAKEKIFCFPGKESVGRTSPGAGGQMERGGGKDLAVFINVFDLLALRMFDLVFEKDFYYNKRRKRTLVIGFSGEKLFSYQKKDFFSFEFNPDILAKLKFDLFLETAAKDWKIYSGSAKGRALIKEIGLEGKVVKQDKDKSWPADAKVAKLKDKIKKTSPSFFKKWADICLACGKCAINCPTCFCFDFEDKFRAASAKERLRRWATCYGDDFSKIAGNQKFLKTIEQRMHNWYLHKFWRIPEKLKWPGCVSCGRCSQVCPAGIKIEEIIKEIRDR